MKPPFRGLTGQRTCCGWLHYQLSHLAVNRRVYQHSVLIGVNWKYHFSLPILIVDGEYAALSGAGTKPGFKNQLRY
jgi:hypothetical protein